MNRITLVAATLVLSAGCKKNTDEKPATIPTNTAMMGSGSGSSAIAAAAKPLTPDELAKHVHDCWGFWGAGKWDDLQNCYAKDASYDAPGGGVPPFSGSAAIVELFRGYRAAFPDQKGQTQLLLVNGKKTVAITLITGKNTGALKTPAGDLLQRRTTRWACFWRRPSRSTMRARSRMRTTSSTWRPSWGS